MGSKIEMIQKIFLPLLIFDSTSSQKQLWKIANSISYNTMNHFDKQLPEEIFTHVKLEQNMPKLTEKKELFITDNGDCR
jgi:hypothetical protein